MLVYRGGELWLKALDSLAKCREQFDQIVISFDGPDRFILSQEIRRQFHVLDARVLVTQSELTAAEHFIWLFSEPERLGWDPDQKVMLLTEDDVLIQEELVHVLARFRETPRSITFGPWIGSFASNEDARKLEKWSFTTKSSRSTIGSGSRAISCYGNPIKFLDNVARSGAVTSIGGLGLEVRCLTAFAAFLSPLSTGHIVSSGVRAEYVLAGHPSIETVIQANAPYVIVSLHSDRESTSMPREQWLNDEMVYLLWVLFWRRRVSTFKYVMVTIRLCRILCQYPRLVGRVIPISISFLRLAHDL